MEQHTPGPWVAVAGANPATKTILQEPYSAAGQLENISPRVEIASTTERNAQANARLISAAPELLEALEEQIKCCSACGGKGTYYTMSDETEIGQAPGSSGTDCHYCADARAAIAQARGQETKTSQPSEPPLSEAGLKEMMSDPRYWRERDPEIVQKVRDGVRRLFPS